MDDLIFDCYSIFYQIMIQVFPTLSEMNETAQFQANLTCYIMAGIMFLIVIFAMLRLFTAFGKVVLSWFSRGS